MTAMKPTLKQTIAEIAERLRTQDNRATASPLFCLQIKVREVGFDTRWETVMVAFTEQGLKDYMALNGHNVNMQAYNGETRIYVETLYRCDEMIAIRDALMHGRFELDA